MCIRTRDEHDHMRVSMTHVRILARLAFPKADPRAEFPIGSTAPFPSLALQTWQQFQAGAKSETPHGHGRSAEQMGALMIS